ncbi:MAG: response regulator [Myxococcales bacterium]
MTTPPPKGEPEPGLKPGLKLAAGQEVLVVDKEEQVARGLQTLLGRLGLVVSVATEPVRARDLLINKFFAVALFDVDTPATGEGLELLRFARDKSPLTTVIVMTARKAFDIGVAGFRGGAADVVVKEPSTVPYLKDRVVTAAAELMALSDRSTLLEEVSEMHEEFLRRMRDLSRQRLDMEDRLLGREEAESGSVSDICSVLLVNDDPDAGTQLAAVFPEDKGWQVTLAQTGGESLDLAHQLRPQIVVVKDPLPDLPARTVVNSVKTSAPDAVAILYQPPARKGGVGEVKMVEGSRVMVLVSEYRTPDQLVGPMTEIREGIRQKLKERRYLQMFRQSNLEFLQRYQNLRQKIQAAIARSK